MKIPRLVLLAATLLATCVPGLASAAAFTPGNLVIYRIGSGIALTNAAQPVFVDEYTTSGTLVQSIALPTTASGAQKQLTASGTASSEGLLTRSADGNYIVLTGYGADSGTSAIAGTNTATVPRVIGRIDAAGSIDTSTALTNFSTNNIRGATSSNGTDLWATGANDGVRYAVLGTAGSATQVSGTITNLRGVSIYGGQLYISTSSGSAVRVGTVGSGTPTTTGQTIANLPGFPTAGSPYAFAFADLDGSAGVDTIYVASDDATALTKYSLVGGNWVSNGVVGGASDTYRGLTISVTGTTVTIYATRKGGTGAAGGGELVSLVDSSGYNGAFSGTPTLLASAAANTAFRGVALAPGVVATQPDLTASISGPGTATVGVSYNYTIAVANVGAATANAVAVDFTLPSGVTFVGAVGDNGFSGVEVAGVVKFTGGTVAVGSPATLTVTVSAPSATTVTVAPGAVVADPEAAIAETNESNNASTGTVNTVVSSTPNTAPTIQADTVATTNRLRVSVAGPANVSGVINDPSDPARTIGIVFTVADAETAVGSLAVTADSSNTAVVTNGGLSVSGSGATRTVTITPSAVGYSTITVTVTDAGLLTGTYTINYAASAASNTPSTTRYLTGKSDASTAVALDASFMFVADDEDQVVRLYPRGSSGAAVAEFDFTTDLQLTQLSGGIPREVDIEASARVGNRIYWLGSHSNGSAGQDRPNRRRIFATDITGSGASTTLSYVGRYDGLRADLLAWDSGNGHGLGANALGLVASTALVNPIPEAPDGSGFNIEGLVFAPGSTTTAYVAFRAPLQTTTTRDRALIVPVANFDALVAGNPAVGPAAFGTPIFLDLGGRGIREISKNGADEYLIIAGSADATGNFALYTWNGNPATAPVAHTVNLAALATGGSFESIVEVPNPLTTASSIQLLTDNGDTVFYGDAIIAKDLPAEEHKKSRFDTVTLGAAIAMQKIHDVQGSGTASPLVGQVVTIEGIVVGYYPGLSGFFVQEEDADADADPATSEGIFIFNPTVVAVGDKVRVTGTVSEFGTAPNTLTELGSATVSIQSSGNPLPTPVAVTLPVANGTALERYEGMRVTFSQTLTVTDTFDLGHFGEVTLSANGRLIQPTNVIDPNDNPASGTNSTGISNVAAVLAAQDLNTRSSIIIEDGSTASFPGTIQFWDNTQNTLRLGSTADNLAGIMHHSFGSYRVLPQAITWTFAQRPLTPPAVGTANVKIGGMNTLNYFNGNGLGGGFPTSRGADSLAEFNRQRAKTIQAIHQLGADVVGLMEIENDQIDGPQAALEDLVGGLNAVAGAGTWASVLVDHAFYHSLPGGTDEIRPAIIYKTAVVTPFGTSMASGDSAFGNGRAPVAQTFTVTATGQKFTVVANHFKSKGSPPSSGPDVDQGDGQSAWNATRRLQALALLNFVSGTVVPTAGDPKVVLLGDFNAYEEEDPMDVLRAGGYTALASGITSYSFDAQSGALDHVLVSAALLPRVTGADKWHINADEPTIIDYNVENKLGAPGCSSACTAPDYYAASPFRVSDHDPVLVGLFLAAVPTAPQNVQGTAGNAQIVLTYTAPSSDGGSAVTGYNASCTDGGSNTGSGSSVGAGLTITVSSLVNGVTYSCTVTATNAIGTGPASTAAAGLTPSTVPGAPQNVQGTAGNTQIVLTYLAPASNGGSAVTGYSASCTDGGSNTGTGNSVGAGLTINVSSLVNGVTYSCTVTAANANGSGAASTAATGLTPSTIPGAPQNVQGTAGNTQIVLTYLAPASNGGSATTGYSASCTDGGSNTGSGNSVGAGLTITVGSLVNGVTYSCTVTAANANGPGAASTAATGLTPSAVPDAPTNVQGTAGDATATITYLAPANNGGSPLTGYTATCTGGSGATGNSVGTALTITLAGLTNGTTYTCTVVAKNANGSSVPSASVQVSPQQPSFALTVTKTGAGAGSVTSAPAGINCAPTCVGTFANGSSVILTATASAGSTFTGWSGACTGTGTCNVTMSADQSVTATFEVSTFALTVTKAGAGTGTVTSTAPASPSINCGATCSASYGSGTVVTLTAAASIGSTFNGWSGACTGTGTCNVTMDAAKSVTATFDNPPRLGNISTRMHVFTGNDVMIGGFIIGAGPNKRVAIVTTGPSLTQYGIANALAHPTVTLVRQSDQTVIASNDGWQNAANAAQLSAAGFAPPDPVESAILVDLAPGAYTAIVQGAGGGTGVGIVAVYEVGQLDTPIINISTRGQVGTGNDVMIGGFVIQGSGPQQVAIVATGPSLTQFGIANALANPTLTLVRQSDQTVIATNDDWQSASNASTLQSLGFAPSNPLESAILITLQPGAYTAIVTGAGGGTGVGIVGVYKAN